MATTVLRRSVCGVSQASLLGADAMCGMAARAISYPERMTRQPILLIQARNGFTPTHDQDLKVECRQTRPAKT